MSDTATSSSDQRPSGTPPSANLSGASLSSADLSGANLSDSSSLWGGKSSSVHLARSKQTWTGAGTAAGYVLRYLVPMRRLMIDVVGPEREADRALAILVAHLVKAGFSGHDKGRLRDFLIRGIRSAAKARFDEIKQDSESGKTQNGKPIALPNPPRVELAQLESSEWIGYWRDGLLQRAWRSLERYQHAVRHGRVANFETPVKHRAAEDTLAKDSMAKDTVVKDAMAKDTVVKDAAAEDLVHDALRTAMSYPGESIELWANRVASKAGRAVTPDEVRAQIELGRVRFAQQIADEVAQTLEQSESKAIHAEIKALGLAKAFAGVKVLG